MPSYTPTASEPVPKIQLIYTRSQLAPHPSHIPQRQDKKKEMLYLQLL